MSNSERTMEINSSIFKVLIVEDDPIQSLLLDRLLTSLGYTIVGKAESGHEAINLANKLKPDLITMDIMLSGNIDGIEAAKVIQKERDVALVYLSGNKDKNIHSRASETSYMKFFRKPFDLRSLKNFFEELIAIETVL